MQEANKAKTFKHPWLERMHKYSFVSALEENPSQSRAVFVLNTVDFEEDCYRANLWGIWNNEIKQLGTLGDSSKFTWENDDCILFPAKRRASEVKRSEEGIVETNYYRLDLSGGEAISAFTIPLPVDSLYPLGNEKYLFTSTLSSAEDEIWLRSETERKEYYNSEKQKNFRTVLDRIPYRLNNVGFLPSKSTRLMFFNAKENSIKVLSPKSYSINGVYVSPDKSKIYFTGSKVSQKANFTDGLWELDPESLKISLLSLDTKLNIYTVFEREEKLIFIASDMKEIGLNQNPTLWSWNSEKRKAVQISEEEIEFGNSVGTDVFLGRTRSFANYEDSAYIVQTLGSKSILQSINSDLSFSNICEKTGAVEGFARINGENFILGLYDMKLAEIYKVRTNGEIEQITHFNDKLYEEYAPLVPKPLNFKSNVDGVKIDGFVLLPPNFETGKAKSYPAILDIHGGPKTTYGEVYSHEMQSWANEGYIVFFCNPHGSSGRGDNFSDIRGKYGEIDYQDIMDFTDLVLEKYPEIDPDKLGVTGGSYGGFMTNWIITHTNRFKVAATQRSITNWTSFYGSSDIGYYFATDQNKIFIEDDKFYETLWEHSPMKFIDNVKTPTLLIHAEKDYRCPVEQAYQLFVGLLDRNIDSRLILFHNENHELSRSGKPQAREERLMEITRWMNMYLKDLNEENTDMEMCVMGFC